MDPESIFSAALDKSTPDERDAFLREACGDDAALRAEIDALLAAHNDAGSFLERTPEELEATASRLREDAALAATDADAWRKLLEPTNDPDSLGRISGYEVAEPVGRGGMGVVLRATDPKLNRVVAIKLLAPEFATSVTAVRRFLREAQAAAAVAHDHVVTIHAIDEQVQPPIIVMEYVPGKSLQQKIDAEGALDLRSILRIGMQTAAGLAAAHRQGLVHRDIKPANILLENGIERVKLTDFGLARAVDDIGMTRTGQITGTPQYMSPEQAQGQRIDHRTDLFSLGCVLYAMCTGQAAFRADSAVAVMHRIVHDTPRPIRDVNEDIPAWLCGIVDRLLAKEADDRFDSAEEVEQLLGRCLAHLQQPDVVPLPDSVSASHTSATVSESPADSDAQQKLPRWFFLKVRPWFVLTVIGIAAAVSLLAEFGSTEAAVLAVTLVWVLAVPLLLFLLVRKLLHQNARELSAGKPPHESQGAFWFVLFAMGPLIAMSVTRLFVPDNGFLQVAIAGAVGAAIAGWLIYQRSRLDTDFVEQQKHQTLATRRRRLIAGILLLAAVAWIVIAQHLPVDGPTAPLARERPQPVSEFREGRSQPAGIQPFARVDMSASVTLADRSLTETSRKRAGVAYSPNPSPSATSFDYEPKPVVAFEQSQNGSMIAAAYRSGAFDGNVVLWRELAAKKLILDTPGVVDVSIIPDGTGLAWVSGGHQIHVAGAELSVGDPGWHLADGSAIERVEWAPSGYALAAATREAAFVWMDSDRSSPGFGVEAGESATVGAIVWQPNGRTIVCGTSAGELVLLTVAGPQDISECRFNVAPANLGISSLKWSRDGRTLLVGRSNGDIQLLNMTADGHVSDLQARGNETASEIIPVTTFSSGNASAASVNDISPDGSLIAVAENEVGEPRIRLIAYRPNGKSLRDNVEDRLLTEADGGHSLPITALRFSSDGRSLLSGSEDGTIKRWQIFTPSTVSD